MKTFHEFFGLTNPIVEELNDYQKKRADGMHVGRDTKEDHDKVFGAGNDKLVIPFDHVDTPISHNNRSEYQELPHTRTIMDKLAHHGYHTDEYQSGMAAHKDTPTKKVKISKILEQHGGDQDAPYIHNKAGNYLTYSQAYAADPTRASRGSKQLVITRGKHDVCGMSTGRGWTSCMQMPSFAGDSNKGINQHFLKNDIQHGTLTAYITKAGDDTLKSPIGRVNLKQFVNGSHRIYRPEANTYGSMSKSTKNALREKVGAWSEKSYESKPGIYTKNPSLYNDDGNSLRMEKPIETNSDMSLVASRIRDNVVNANRAGLEHAENEQYKHDDYEAMGNHENNMYDLVNKIHNQLPHKERALYTIHSLISNAEDHDGEGSDDFYSDKHTSEKDADDYIHHHTINRSKYDKEADLHEIQKLPSHEAFALHKKIDSTINNTSEPESHDELKTYHAKLIDNVMSTGSESEKNQVLHDMIGATDSHARYYEHMHNETHSIFDAHHPATLTTNPRTIHSLMTSTNGAIPQAESFRDSEVAEHIGKHADEKLAHALVHGELVHHFANEYSAARSNGVHDDFVRGLNTNPHGEHIQHSLTSQMLLSGGHNDAQRTTLPVNAVGNYRRTLVPKGERLDRESGGASVPYVEADAADDTHQLEAYKNIAQHSKFRSVVSKLKNREDTQHPEIQSAIADNEHGLHESSRVISLRGFLIEASPAFEVPNEKACLNKSRYRMPQVKVDDILADKNLKTSKKIMQTKDLTPSQSQFNWDKVKGIAASGKPQGGVIVSSDNYVIDGHHRFLAGHAINGRVGVVQVDKPADELIDYLKEAPYAKFKKLYEAKVDPKDDKKAPKKEKALKVEPTEIVTEPEESDLLTTGEAK
jgi:hypothetical protein